METFPPLPRLDMMTPWCRYAFHISVFFQRICIAVIMGDMASQFTSPTIVYSAVYSGRDQRKYQSSASLAFVRGIHWWPVNSPHKRPVTRQKFPFDAVLMESPDADGALSKGQYYRTLQWRHNERHGVSNHQQLDVYFTICFGQNQRNIKALRYWHFVRGFTSDCCKDQ